MVSIDESELLGRLRSEILDLPDEWIVLVETAGDKFLEVNLGMLNILLNEENYSGVYVTLNRSYENISSLMKSKGINLSNLFFIDGVTMQNIASNKLKTDERVIYIESIKSLTDMTIAVTQIVPRIDSKKKFLFLDSLSTLLLFNSPELIGRFSHALTIKMRAMGVSGAIVSIPEETDSNFRQMLGALCDKIIKV